MTPNESSPRRSFLKGALATPVVLAGSGLLAPPKALAQGLGKGPSTRVEPYLAPSIAGAKVVSILTVGESSTVTAWSGYPTGSALFAAARRISPCS